MNKVLLIALFSLVFAISLALSFADEKDDEYERKLIALKDFRNELEREDVDVDGDEPYEERKEENGYVAGVKDERYLSGQMQKSADPALPALGLKLLGKGVGRVIFRRRRRRRRQGRRRRRWG